MPKNHRAQFRKFTKKEQSQIKAQSKPKTVTPEVMSTRFNHLLKNPHDSQAVDNYLSQLVKALKTDNPQLKSQYQNMLKEQVNKTYTALKAGTQSLQSENLASLARRLRKLNERR